MTSVCIVMPAWNESEGIGVFISELNAALTPWRHSFVVVDDLSSDDTGEKARAAGTEDSPVQVHRNHVNLGHGPSTIKALQLGLESEADLVVALDGDGQFNGLDVARLVRGMEGGSEGVIEGVRTSRDDPVYRQVVSFATRALVWTRAHEWPQDANTPLRVYRRETLGLLLPRLPENAMTPNLLISAITRRSGIRFAESRVSARHRLGDSQVGTTWGKGRRLPSRRFIKFCAAATREWTSTSFDLPDNFS